MREHRVDEAEILGGGEVVDAAQRVKNSIWEGVYQLIRRTGEVFGAEYNGSGRGDLGKVVEPQTAVLSAHECGQRSWVLVRFGRIPTESLGEGVVDGCLTGNTGRDAFGAGFVPLEEIPTDTGNDQLAPSIWFEGRHDKENPGSGREANSVEWTVRQGFKELGFEIRVVRRIVAFEGSGAMTGNVDGNRLATEVGKKLEYPRWLPSRLNASGEPVQENDRICHYAPTCVSWPSQYFLRSSRLRILFDSVFGISAANSIDRGIL